MQQNKNTTTHTDDNCQLFGKNPTHL